MFSKHSQYNYNTYKGTVAHIELSFCLIIKLFYNNHWQKCHVIGMTGY